MSIQTSKWKFWIFLGIHPTYISVRFYERKKGLQTVTIELDIPMEILKSEDKDEIIADITGILLNKRTYTSEQLAEYDFNQYS